MNNIEITIQQIGKKIADLELEIKKLIAARESLKSLISDGVISVAPKEKMDGMVFRIAKTFTGSFRSCDVINAVVKEHPGIDKLKVYPALAKLVKNRKIVEHDEDLSDNGRIVKTYRIPDGVKLMENVPVGGGK